MRSAESELSLSPYLVALVAAVGGFLFGFELSIVGAAPVRLG